MGKKALQAKRVTIRRIRAEPLTPDEHATLRERASYEGSPHHKASPGDFGFTPPSAPRRDKTLCDEAGVSTRAIAEELFAAAIERGLVSETTTPEGLPKQIWVVDQSGRVFEAMHGGTEPGCYHGYPIRRADPLFDQVSKAWKGR